MKEPANPSETRFSRFSISVYSRTSAALEYDPNLSLARIPENLTDEFGECVGVLHYPIVFAGSTASSPVGRGLRVLARRAERSIEALTQPEPDLNRIVQTLFPNEVAARLLWHQVAPAIRTIVQWNLNQQISNASLLEWYAEEYAEGNSTVDATEVRDALRVLQSEATEHYANPSLAGILEGVSQEYSRLVANAIADLALQPKLSGLFDPQPDLHRIEQLDIEERCRQFATVLESHFERTTDVTMQTLKEELQAASEAAVQPSIAIEGTLPVVDVPPNVLSDKQPSEPPIDGSLRGYPTGLTHFLARSCQDGKIGGVVYPHEDGARGWLVNPWADVYWNSGSYRERWSRALVADAIISHLIAEAREVETGQAAELCPLCHNTQTKCGGHQCTYHDLIRRVMARHDALVTAVREEMDTHSDSYIGLLSVS
ncbi:hypothetical protein VB773_19820 [Haloarculaceae archaeon H-GB2-1]|nr:hypothetical protein [Haloarculaceae archaeon H-GB1-1]MEA5409603.1 hypothetical protein [Haloarculaceae archaeon H-GB2-1]